MEIEDKVEANRKALDFIHSIDFKLLNRTVFKDQLAVVDDDGQKIGEMNTSVEETIRNGEVCYLVRLHRYSVLNGVSTGHCVHGYISLGLKTINLTDHEYSEVDGKVMEKRTTIEFDGNQYIVNKKTTKGENSNNIERIYTAASMTGFISEGATIIIERIMCLNEETPEDAVFLSLDTSLTLVTMTYEKLLDEMFTIEDQQMQTVGIQRETRSIFRPVLIESRYLADGHMVNCKIQSINLNVKLLVLPTEEDEKVELAKPDVENLPWKEDMELTSYFIERKEELKNNHQTYLRHKPELQAMLKDFLQYALLRKPDDICKFAASYFGSLSTKKNPPSFANDESLSIQNEST